MRTLSNIALVVCLFSGVYAQSSVDYTKRGEIRDVAVVVPQGDWEIATSTWTVAMSDSIRGFAAYLESPIQLKKAVLSTGTLGGSGSRAITAAIYSASFSRIDTVTVVIDWPGNGTGGELVFGGTRTIGPGLVYVCFSTSSNNSVTMQFRSAQLTNATVASGAVAVQSATQPLMFIASEKLTTSTGWPASLTPTAMTISHAHFPYIVLVGTNVSD